MRQLTPEQAASIARRYTMLNRPVPSEVRAVLDKAKRDGAPVVVPEPARDFDGFCCGF